MRTCRRVYKDGSVEDRLIIEDSLREFVRACVGRKPVCTVLPTEQGTSYLWSVVEGNFSALSHECSLVALCQLAQQAERRADPLVRISGALSTYLRFG